MKIIFTVGAGSFIGGVLRYLLSLLINNRSFSGFPYGTLVVNILGCFLIGIIYGLADKGSVTENWRLFLATGILGGFTTFSAFSYETFSMLRAGSYGQALTYISASILIGLCATYLGSVLGSKL